MGRTVKSELVEVRERAPAVKSFLFSPAEPFNYTAGQFAIFSFEYGGTEYSKHFTISNSPLRENIEMTTIMSGSEYKKALDSLKEGHTVNLRGPFGKFTLNELKEEYACFLAGGIGITPVKSMLEYASDISTPLKGSLFYSNRSRQRISFKEEMDAFEKNMEEFIVVHTLTKLDRAELRQWQGETGYIDSQMIRKKFPPYSQSGFYIVGPPAFNRAMKKMVSEELEVPSELITLEKFTGY